MSNFQYPEGVTGNDVDELCEGKEPRRDDDDYDDEECCECGGEGYVTRDCDEDCCCCADPETQHALIPCPVCNPKGDH